jgi:hypothetical protein
MHISEIDAKRTTKTGDVLKEGDEITAQVVDVDARGRGKFSLRSMLQPGETVSKYIKRPPATLLDASPVKVDALAATTSPAAHESVTSAASSGRQVQPSPGKSSRPVGAEKVLAKPWDKLREFVSSPLFGSTASASDIPAPSVSQTAPSHENGSAALRAKESSPPAESVDSSEDAPVDSPQTGVVASDPLATGSGQVFWRHMFFYLLPGLQHARELRSAQGRPPLSFTASSPSWLEIIGVSADGKYLPSRVPQSSSKTGPMRRHDYAIGASESNRHSTFRRAVSFQKEASKSFASDSRSKFQSYGARSHAQQRHPSPGDSQLKSSIFKYSPPAAARGNDDGRAQLTVHSDSSAELTSRVRELVTQQGSS